MTASCGRSAVGVPARSGIRGRPGHNRNPGRNRNNEDGLTLVELAVVLAILGVLAGIATIAVTGTGVRARGAAKAHDILEVQKAVNSYHALHPQEKWPTAEKTIGVLNISAGSLPNLSFSTDGMSFVPIDWDATFTTTLDGTKTLVPSFLPKAPRHASDVTLDTDGDGSPDQILPTLVWVLDQDGIVHVLLKDADY